MKTNIKQLCSLPIKNFILLISFAVICICNSSCSQSIIKKGILWEISKEGNDKKSYILGTYHFNYDNCADYLFLDTMPKYKEVLQYVDVVVFDYDGYDTSYRTVLYERGSHFKRYEQYPQYAYLPDDVTDFASLFKKSSQYNYVNNFLEEFKKDKDISSFNHDRLKPNFIINLIQYQANKAASAKAKRENFISMYNGIYHEVNKMDKKMDYLYAGALWKKINYEADSCFFSIMDLSEQANRLYKFCKSYSPSYSKKVDKYYKKGNMRRLYSVYNKSVKRNKKIMSTPHFSKLIDDCYIDLNYQWMPSIKDKIHKKSCLYTVNVFRLPGKHGLINILRKEGYTVKSVDLHSTE